MERRAGLAIVTLGALSWAALAQSQSAVTLPLKPPPQKQAEGDAPAEQQTAPGKQAAAATKPPMPVAPQALFTLPPPALTTEPLFPTPIIEDGTLPPPKLDSTLVETKEKPAAAPPLPQPKPPAPNIAESVAPTAPMETKPRTVEMEPIDDYRPRSVIVDPSALDRTLLRKKEKAAAAPPMPRTKPTAAVAAAAEAPPLRGGVTESIDNGRHGNGPSLSPATETPAKMLMPRSKPVLQKPAAKTPAPGEMAPVDDIPGGKLYKAERGKAPTFRCFVRDVMAFYDRTHIRCYNKARSKLNFFAVDTNQPVAATVLEKGLAAMQSGKPVTLSFAPEADLNPSNCERANCRRLIDIKD
jgi:hypothetical protein